MNFEELKSEIFLVYRDYEIDHAYSFASGMIYACFTCNKINDQEMGELININLETYKTNKTRYLS